MMKNRCISNRELGTPLPARPGTLNSNYDLQAVFLHKRTSLPRESIRPQLRKWLIRKSMEELQTIK